MISYAQNFEDVMLWRALKHVKEGFYIDVGAQHPIIDSVSLAFYEHGWRGIHVEPSAYYAALLREKRPGEIVIEAAVGKKRGILKFFEITETGLSTGDPDVAKRHRASGYVMHEKDVPCIKLADIFKAHANQQIHWLKIDVEGLEKDVLLGWMPSKARPWVVVVESTRPSTQSESYMEWEKLILDLGYEFVFFDGLNRYYLFTNHLELKGAFLASPNIFDDFVLNGTASAPFCSLLNKRIAAREQELVAQAAQSHAEIKQVETNLQRLENEGNTSKDRIAGLNQAYKETLARQHEAQIAAGKAEARASKLQTDLDAVHAANHHHWQLAEAREQQIQAIYKSHSWRITAPLRWCGHQARLVRQQWLVLRFKALVKKIVWPSIRHGAAFLSARPGLRLRCVALIRRFGLYDSLRSFYFRCSGQQDPGNLPSVAVQGVISNLTVEQLTPRARLIYADLQAAIEHRQRENR